VRAEIAEVPGIADLRVERLSGLPQLRIQVDRAATARAGLTPGDVVRAVRIGLVGEEHAPVWVGQRRYDLVVRLQDSHRSDPAAISALLVDGHDGTRIPLGQLATLEETTAPGTIRREAGSRRVAVEASVAGRDLGGAAADVRSRLAELELPAGYFVDVGGRVESQERASRALRWALAVAGLAVVLLLYLALGRMPDVLAILVSLPVALVGAVLALALSGGTWNVSSLVGLCGLLGIAVQNGLVLVAQTRTLLAEGRPFDQALREACVGRVRPKLMTAGTAILGLLPMVLFRLEGTEIERPLAIVMIGGLVTSTLFTLLALPAFYALAHRLSIRIPERGR
jgi:cobalt-zinc-cadmium resistance protein CzcA